MSGYASHDWSFVCHLAEGEIDIGIDRGED